MTDVADVVIVGGGIGGGSLAFALARAGLGVTVLEASTAFEDRVRGESMHAWGLKEAAALGVDQVMLDAGAHITTLWKQFTQGFDAPGEIPVSMMVDGIPGTLNLRHPDACQSLVDAAVAAGATVVRGVHDVKLSGGSPPSVTYVVDDDVREVRPTLVVGADGRASTVRKQIGVTLERDEPVNYIAGLLVDGLEGVPEDFDFLAGERDLFYVFFHQGNGRARAYTCTGLSGMHRFAGPNGVSSFLDAWRSATSFPWGDQVATATPAGPIATYPGDDTWTTTPFADGVVLVGDAAGYNDPIIGQGLSIAMRDARTVRDLVLDGARTCAAFAPYAEERVARMKRLRYLADVISVAMGEDCDNRQARRAFLAERMGTMDPEIMGLLGGAFAGPELVPDELMETGLLDRIRAA